MRKLKSKVISRKLQINNMLNGKDSGKYADITFNRIENGNKIIFEGTKEQLRIKQHLENDLILKFGTPVLREVDERRNKSTKWNTEKLGEIMLEWNNEKNSTSLIIQGFSKER